MTAWLHVRLDNITDPVLQVKEVLAKTMKTARIKSALRACFNSGYHLNSCQTHLHCSLFPPPILVISLGLKKYMLLEVPVIPEQVGWWYGAL